MGPKDVSDWPFTGWSIREDSSFWPIVSHRCVGTTAKLKVSVDWTTSLAADGDDQLLIYTSASCGDSGTPIGTATVSNPNHTPKTAHSVQWEVDCTLPAGTGLYVVAKSQHGSAWAVTQCTYVGTTTCISCGSQCNPPCEFD